METSDASEITRVSQAGTFPSSQFSTAPTEMFGCGTHAESQGGDRGDKGTSPRLIPPRDLPALQGFESAAGRRTDRAGIEAEKERNRENPLEYIVKCLGRGNPHFAGSVRNGSMPPASRVGPLSDTPALDLYIDLGGFGGPPAREFSGRDLDNIPRPYSKAAEEPLPPKVDGPRRSSSPLPQGFPMAARIPVRDLEALLSLNRLGIVDNSLSAECSGNRRQTLRK